MRKKHPMREVALPIGRIGDRPATLRAVKKWASKGVMGEVNDLCAFARKQLRKDCWPCRNELYLYSNGGTFRVAKNDDFEKKLSPGEKQKFGPLSTVIRSIDRNADAPYYAARVIECAATLHQLRKQGDIDGCISTARELQHFYWCLKAELAFRRPYERHQRQVNNLIERGNRVSRMARATKQKLQRAADVIWEFAPQLTASAVASIIAKKINEPWIYRQTKSGTQKLLSNTIRRKIKKPVAVDQQ